MQRSRSLAFPANIADVCKLCISLNFWLDAGDVGPRIRAQSETRTLSGLWWFSVLLSLLHVSWAPRRSRLRSDSNVRCLVRINAICQKQPALPLLFWSLQPFIFYLQRQTVLLISYFKYKLSISVILMRKKQPSFHTNAESSLTIQDFMMRSITDVLNKHLGA